MSDFFGISPAESEREATYQDQVGGNPDSFVEFETLETPTDVAVMFNTEIREGRATLYPWQVKIHDQFAQPNPPGGISHIALAANNGSGKSQFVVAPCAVWLGMRYKQSRVIITSSSGTQLDKQTCDAIVLLLQAINNLFGEKIWKINYRHYTNLKTGGEIICYATDEPGKAEGFHPKVIGGKFAIMIDEAKSLPEPMFEAIGRCTGNTHRLEVSSPGGMNGSFYRHCCDKDYQFTRVSYLDCPHVNVMQVEQDRRMYGESSAYFRSKHLGEFTSEDEQVVIPIEKLDRYYRLIASGTLLWYNKGHKRAGIDIASVGKCESVFSLWDGGIQQEQIPFHIGDTTQCAQHIKYLINKFDVKPEDCNVDDGNVGKAIIDMLWRDGFVVNRIINQAAALESKVYGNRGAEMYFTFEAGLREGILQPLDEPTLRKQLSGRYYRTHKQSGKIILEPKQEAIANGHGSPDRSDAAVLAFAKCNVWTFDKWKSEAGSEAPKLVRPKAATSLTSEDILRLNQERKYSHQISGINGSVRKGRSQRTRDLLQLNHQRTTHI